MVKKYGMNIAHLLGCGGGRCSVVLTGTRCSVVLTGTRCSVVLTALRYKANYRGFETR
jgi:hypothetical protein